MPENSIVTKTVLRWDSLLNVQSQESLRLKLSPNQTLGNDQEMAQQVIQGKLIWLCHPRQNHPL